MCHISESCVLCGTNFFGLHGEGDFSYIAIPPSLQVSSIISAPSVHNIYIQSFRQRSDRKAETDIGAARRRVCPSEAARRDFLRLQKSNQSLKLRWPNGRYIDTHWVTQQFMAFLKDQLCYEMSFLGNTITTN